VLCTYQGERYIDEQLKSLTAQTWPVAIRIFDDCSSDETIARASEHCRADQDTVFRQPHNVGYVANFEHGIRTVLDQGFNYIALSDQDDVWHAERVQRGMQLLQKIEGSNGATTPVLVHSDLGMIDEDGVHVHPSFLNFRGYAIGANRDLALVLGQNGVMGNTVLINRALAELSLPFPDGLHVHDYWLALIAEVYGRRQFIVQPLVDYRIHQSNASNTAKSITPGPLQRITRFSWRKLWQRDFKLPFKEDSRLEAIETLCKGNANRQPLDASDTELIEAFLAYLRFNQSRLSHLRDMFRYGFLKHGLRHRLRFVLAQLTTRRYPRGS
jgi:glycosyltransferase involved in cell wall biosynthesis